MRAFSDRHIKDIFFKEITDYSLIEISKLKNIKVLRFSPRFNGFKGFGSLTDN
jgi:hypothetical protein